MAARSSGVTAFIRKPFSAEQLVKKLRVVARVLAIKKT
jgi:DNA-binding response OmpR family regulator